MTPRQLLDLLQTLADAGDLDDYSLVGNEGEPFTEIEMTTTVDTDGDVTRVITLVTHD